MSSVYIPAWHVEFLSFQESFFQIHPSLEVYSEKTTHLIFTSLTGGNRYFL